MIVTTHPETGKPFTVSSMLEWLQKHPERPGIVRLCMLYQTISPSVNSTSTVFWNFGYTGFRVTALINGVIYRVDGPREKDSSSLGNPDYYYYEDYENLIQSYGFGVAFGDKARHGMEWTEESVERVASLAEEGV